MANAVDWEVWGTFRDESFTASSGKINQSINSLAKQVGVNWLHVVAPMIRDEAKRLALQHKDTGKMSESIYDRYNDAEGYAEIGSDRRAAKGRVYILFQEIGSNGKPGRHALSNAMTNVIGKMQ